MALTSVAEKVGFQARSGEYAGTETILDFGSPVEELDALRHSCGVFDLGWRGKLVISGEDRVRWLNGMVSNDTRDLRQDFGNYSFVLNAQGRIQSDLLAFQRGEFYIVESEAGQLPALREFFDRYIIMDDVEIGDISDRLTSIGVAGPRACEMLCSAGLKPGAAHVGQILDGSWNGIGFSLIRDPIELRNWYELWLAPENVEPVWHALTEAGAAPVGAQALEWQRILLGLPRMGLDLGQRELPQETGQAYALHFSKGCYIGQEIVERVHSRGQVHRLLSGLIVEGDPPPHGSKVTAGDKEVGDVTSSAAMAVDGARRSVALGYLRRNLLAELRESGEQLWVDGSKASVAPLPFQF